MLRTFMYRTPSLSLSMASSILLLFSKKFMFYLVPVVSPIRLSLILSMTYFIPYSVFVSQFEFKQRNVLKKSNKVATPESKVCCELISRMQHIYKQDSISIPWWFELKWKITSMQNCDYLHQNNFNIGLFNPIIIFSWL